MTLPEAQASGGYTVSNVNSALLFACTACDRLANVPGAVIIIIAVIVVSFLVQ
jgi:hypothetical protein